MACKSKFQFRSLINRSPEEVFAWHLRDRMLERCIPPYEDESVSILCCEGRPNRIGSKFAIRGKVLGFFSITLNFEYVDYSLNESFSVSAKHRLLEELKYKTVVTPQSAHTSEIVDYFSFSHNFPSLFNPLINRTFYKRVYRILTYKHEMIDHDIGMFRKYPFEKPLKVLISGSHGLIGKNLAYFLEFAGHDVWNLSRNGSTKEKTVVWNPATGECDANHFEGFDVVVHLAGENIGKGRWTKRKKERVLKSRLEGTVSLVQILKGLEKPPKAFISASAIGFYGNRGNEVVDETSGPGKGLFISEVCEEWEKASKELKEKGVRVVHTRFGVVLSSAGGALKKMLTPFKWGLGGKLGSGHQYVSWVAIDDVIGSIYHVMLTPSVQGAVNVVAPNPVQNDTLTKKLSKRLNRWMGPPLPGFVIRLILGQKGEELLLTSTRVEPQRLTESGYHFHYPKLSSALEHVV